MGTKSTPLDVDDDDQMRRHFRRLARDPNIVRKGKVYVDVEGTVHWQVACSDGLCMEGGGSLRKLQGKTCCTTFNVPVTREDVEQVAKVVDEVRKIRDVDHAIRKQDGWWHVDDDGDLYLEDRPSGACVFLSAPRGERPWCTIHEWASNHGVDWRKHKPEGCCLFPLYTLEWGEHVLVTSYGTEYMLDVEPDQRDVLQSFVCFKPPKGVGRSLLVEQREELEYRLGEKRWGKVRAKLNALGHAV